MTAGAAVKPIRVLLVEDNPGDARIILEMLKEVGTSDFQLQVVDRLEPALQRLGRAAVDVVLLDLGLPDSSGLETFRRAHEGAVEEPIIVISGYDDETTAVQAVRDGAQDYLVKGRIDGAALARVIRYSIERQRTEVRLRWLTLAVDQSPASVFITDPRGTIQYVNDRFTQITGFSKAEAIGKTPRILKSGLTPPDYYAALWKTILAGETWRSEIQNRRKNGELYWDAVTVSPIRDQRGAVAHFLAVQEEITKRKEAEQALRERDERFQQIAGNIKEVFFVQSADHRETIYINKAYEDIWGRSVESLYRDPKSFIDPIPEEDRPALFKSIELNRQGEYAGDVEFRVLRPDGTVRWMLSHAVPVRNDRGMVYRIAGVCTDVTERKRAEEHARSLFDNSPLPMLVYDRETHEILAVNTAAIVDYGYTRDEFRSMTVEQLRPEEDLPQFREYVERDDLHGYRRAGVWRHRRKDGSVLMAEVAGHDVTFDNRAARLVAMNDVTARLRAERMQTALYRIANAAHDAAGLDDLLRAVHDIVDTLMPAKSFYIALYDAATDLITFPYFVDEKDPPPPPRRPGAGITDRVLRSGKPLLVSPDMIVEGEQSVGTPSHYWLGVPLKAGERSIGVLAVQTYTRGVRYEEGDKEMLQFVSTQIATAIERKRAEAALRESEQRARTLFETVNLIVLGLNADGTVNYVNPFYLKTAGFTADEVIGRNWFDFLPAELRPKMTGVLQELVDENIHAHYENAILTKSGERRTIAWSNTLVRDPQGRVIGTLSIGEDITERNQLELQLRQAQKMEAIGRLAGGVAHDFNNVLTAVFGYVDLLREELPPESTAQEDLGEVRKAAERAAGLTKQLLAFSRQQVLEPIVLQLNDLVAEFEKMLGRVIGEDVELRLALAKDAGNVRADPGQLHQVIMNLVVNARDAMPTGGKLLIETATAALSEQYAELHQPVVPGDYVMLAVSDTGSGMTADVKARIFEPFFTTKEKGKGTGLGLSTVYGIVKQSGGYVWVYSELGRGTTFKIYLPRVDAPAERIVKPREARSLAGTETILLAEDDTILRPLAQELLEKLGYTVLATEDTPSALQAAQQHAGPIHLLVTDVIMPGPSGRDLARALSQSRPETKVLYISGYTDDAIVHHGMLEPGLNFLQKPFTPAVLARKVREVLDTK